MTPAVPAPLLAVDAPSLLYRAFFALPGLDQGRRGPPGQRAPRHGEPRPLGRRAPRAARGLPVLRRRGRRTTAPIFPELPRRSAPDAGGAREPSGPTPRRLRGLRMDRPRASDARGRRPPRRVRAAGERGGRRHAPLHRRPGHVPVRERQGDRPVPRGGAAKDGPEEIGPAEVRGRYGIEPEQVPDFIALRGDPSDGLPGAKGIGEKTARDLLVAHGTLEGVFEAAAKPGTLRRGRPGRCSTAPTTSARSARSRRCSRSTTSSARPTARRTSRAPRGGPPPRPEPPGRRLEGMRYGVNLHGDHVAVGIA